MFLVLLFACVGFVVVGGWILCLAVRHALPCGIQRWKGRSVRSLDRSSVCICSNAIRLPPSPTPAPPQRPGQKLGLILASQIPAIGLQVGLLLSSDSPTETAPALALAICGAVMLVHLIVLLGSLFRLRAVCCVGPLSCAA
eukprot:RCo030991